MNGILTLAADNPLDHVVNHPFWAPGGWWIWSSHTGNLFITLIIMVFIFPKLARGVATGSESQGNDRFLPAGKASNLFEVICGYLRNEVCKPVLGHHTDKFMPFLWTVFFFILINNVLGMVPMLEIWLLVFSIFDAIGIGAPIANLLGIEGATGLAEHHRAPSGATATGNIWITGILAIFAFLVYFVHGMKDLGIKGFMEHMTGGAPPMLWPIIIPIELAGVFIIKPGALAIRLFANMTAGHVLVATLLMFVGMAFKAAGSITYAGSFVIGLVSTLVLIPIYFLELFVALLQAFIFMFLTTIFIGLMTHHHDHDHESHESALETA